MSPNVFRLSAAALCLCLGGCAAPYLDRSEGVAFGAGDAVASNMVQHMIDPWPRHANQTNISTDGERARRSIQRYQTNRVPLSAGGSFATGAQDAPQAAAPGGAAASP